MSSLVLDTTRRVVPAAARALLVTVARTVGEDKRKYVPVGMLHNTEVGYEFAYLDQATSDPSFRPLPGFRDPDRRYTSPELFPLFAERVISPGRPDRDDYLATLDLDSSSAPWEILGRSGGRRISDSIEVTPVPDVTADGRTECTFLVHGVGYRSPAESDVIANLNPGDPLDIVWEPDNPVNQRAVLVTSQGNIGLGYVPDPLLDYVHEVLVSGNCAVEVRRAHGLDVPAHHRLLVRLTGTVTPDYRPFAA